MKRFLLLFFGITIFFLPGGCQDTAKKSAEIIIEDGNHFPEFLVGKWKAEGKSGWEIVFEENGEISSIVHFFGQVELKPSEVQTFPMKKEGKSIYEPSEWIVNYDSANNVLTVEIGLKYFYSEVGTGIVKGSCSDIFTGTVSEDELIWKANWTIFLNATAQTPENDLTDLSNDPDYGESHDIIFKKVKK